MDPIYPWLDPVEVRRLADRLVKPGREPTVTAADAGFDEAFVGFATDTAPTVVECSRSAVSNPLPTEPQAASSFVARGPFLERIKRFRDWMHQNFAATGVFILDREGAVIFDESNHGRLHFLARSLALASRRPGASAGNVHVKIGVGATLEVIPVETAYGCFVLGAVVPESLSPDSVIAVMDALSLVAAPQGEDVKP
jgi:hypothetical protein